MSPRNSARLAWASCALSAALVAVAIVFTLLSRAAPVATDFSPALEVVLALALLAFPVVGALVASRRPENSIGWLFCAVGPAFGVSGAAHGWAVYTLFAEPGTLPAGAWAAWLASWAFLAPLFAIPPLLFLLFPDGKPPSRRWRPVLWLTAAGVSVATLGSALAGDIAEPPFQGIENPVGLDGSGSLLEMVAGVGFSALLLAILLGAAALVVRFRRARGDERQQLKWFAGAGALFAVACLAAVAPWMGSSDTLGQLLILLTFAAIPVAAGVAILKDHLYDIDVVINRTMVYGGLTATLVLTYLGSVLLLELALRPLTRESDLAVAGSTLAVAALFGPARRRIQRLVDRRFYRRRYDAARTLEGFGARLGDQVDLDSLGSELRTVVDRTVAPAHVSLWLRPARRGR